MSKILEAVVTEVGVLKIFKPDILHGVEPVYPTSWMQGNNGPVNRAVLEPRPTRRSPCRSLHELGDMFIEIMDCRGQWSNRFDVLGLDLLHHVDDVLGSMFDNGKNRPMPNWRIWAQKH